MAKPRGALRIAPMEHVLLARLRNAIHDELLGQMCHLAGVIDTCARFAQQPQSRLMMDLYTGIAKNDNTGLMNGLDVAVRQEMQFDSSHANHRETGGLRLWIPPQVDGPLDALRPERKGGLLAGSG